MPADVKTLMKNLNISEEEAKRVLEEDKKIDKMNKVADIQSDLSHDQIAAAKKARSAGRKVTTYKLNTKEKKVNEPKKQIVSELVNLFANDEVKVVNNEREILFVRDGVKYKIVLSVPRS